MKTYHSVLYTFLALLLSSCSYDGLKNFVIPLEDDKPKSETPIISAQALDGNEWVDGTIDGKKITFVLRYTEKSDWNKVSVRFTTDENASVTDPSESPATLDLSKECTVVTSDGYVPVNYTLKATEFQLITNVKVTINGESKEGVPVDGKINMSFINSNSLPATLELTLNKDVSLVSPTTNISSQNLSSPLTITAKDNKTGKSKNYVLTLTSDWENITPQINTDNVSLPSYMSVFKNTHVMDRKGNTGYIIKIPAGKIDMKTSLKEQAYSSWFINGQKVGDVVKENTDYHVFVGGMSMAYWKPMTKTSVINNGAVVAEGGPYWGYIYMYNCPPTLGVKDGKASISYADILNGKLNKINPPQHATSKSSFTGTLWDVDASVSGYAYPLQNGKVMIENESATDYKALADIERNFKFSTVNGMIVTGFKLYINGSEISNCPAYVSDEQRMARTLIGVNTNGDLFIFVSERYAWANNYMINKSSYPSDGTTLQEAATILKQMGCSDAIAFHQIEYAVTALQNGSTGKDLTTTLKRAQGDLSNATLIMFK
jgi:hypothetical protein